MKNSMPLYWVDHAKLINNMELTRGWCSAAYVVSKFRLILFLFIISNQVVAQIPAFLPMADNVPTTARTAIDGVWTISSIGKRIRIEQGRAYALDGWLHLFVLNIKPNMVVIQNIKPDGYGGFVGDDLPLLGKWQAQFAADGALDVKVAGSMGPVGYRLLPVSLDYSDHDDDQPGFVPAPVPTPRPPKMYTPPETVVVEAANSVKQIGMNCYHDFKPMGSAMLKYAACQKGLGKINALKVAIKAKKPTDVKNIIGAAACSSELKNLTNTIRKKGFKSFSLGVSGEVGAIISGTGEYFAAMNLDLSNTTLYASVGGSLGPQIGGGINGVVSAYYNKANNLSGGGKSLSVALKAFGGAGAAVGLSHGKSARCESFSVTAGVGAEADTGSVGITQTFALLDIKKPDFIHKPDFSKGCKDVTVQAVNRTGKEIKIVDVDFYDYLNKRWRSKIIKNTKVAKGRGWKKVLRLQKVAGDKTKVRVQYRVRKKSKLFKPGWTKIRNSDSKPAKCRTGMRFSLNLN